MRTCRWLSAAFILAASCGVPRPSLEGVDLEAWKADKNGCMGHRARMEEALSNQKNELLALTEMQIIGLLGRPDQNELYTRNQKFYFYYIKASAQCPTAGEKPQRLMIRFNAVGRAQEVLIE